MHWTVLYPTPFYCIYEHKVHVGGIVISTQFCSSQMLENQDTVIHELSLLVSMKIKKNCKSLLSLTTNFIFWTKYCFALYCPELYPIPLYHIDVHKNHVSTL